MQVSQRRRHNNEANTEPWLAVLQLPGIYPDAPLLAICLLTSLSADYFRQLFIAGAILSAVFSTMVKIVSHGKAVYGCGKLTHQHLGGRSTMLHSLHDHQPCGLQATVGKSST